VHKQRPINSKHPNIRLTVKNNQMQKIIGIVQVKGGAGRSTVSTNLVQSAESSQDNRVKSE